MQDLTDSESRFDRAVLAAHPDLLTVIDVRTESEVWARGSLGWIGGREDDGLPDRIVYPDDVGQVQEANAAACLLPDGQAISARCRWVHPNGSRRWVSRRITPFERDDTGAVTQLLVSARDVNDIVQAEEQQVTAALHDPLTGLPNRVLLADRLSTALKRNSRSGGLVPVLFCDLDGFKHVNDSSGHRAGDQVLIVTAERLRAALRPQDTVARVGGDEFVVVLEAAAHSEQEVPPTAEEDGGDNQLDSVSGATWERRDETLIVVNRLMTALSQPITVRSDAEGSGGEVVHEVSVSIGVTFARPGCDSLEVLREADTAMYRAKARGKDRYEVFDSSFRAEALERSHVERALRAALPSLHVAESVDPAGNDRRDPPGDTRGPAEVTTGSNGLSVQYQPIFQLDGLRLVGVEALARFTDAHGLTLPPNEFIPVAEETGLIAPLGRAVLERACSDLAEWHAKLPAWRHLGVAVNVSARQAGLVDLVSDVRDALQRSGLAANLLTLELTESVLLDAGPSTRNALAELHRDGVRISIDDFGTGYASLRYLAVLPVSSVKIDRSFTSGLPDDPTSAIIVRTVASLAHDLGISCVAEGIETDAQLEALPAGLQGQGFLLGRPVSATEILRLLNTPDPHPGIRTRRIMTTSPESPDLAETSGAGQNLRGANNLGDVRPAAKATRPTRPSEEQREGTTVSREDRADERDKQADRRDRLADRRDSVADGRDAATNRHDADLWELLALAEDRDRSAQAADDDASVRDRLADQREKPARSDNAGDVSERKSAALDRLRSARDRQASATDRAALSASLEETFGIAEDRLQAARERAAARADRDGKSQDRASADRLTTRHRRPEPTRHNR
jgi:predicted signal transduction protein with EAL and GGDEF domain